MDQVHLEAIECRSLTDHVLVRLRLTEDGTQFVGQAHDHYDTAEYTGCELTATELTCEAQWQGAEASAALRIHIGPSGTLVGTVRRARARSGVMGCLQVERRGN